MDLGHVWEHYFWEKCILYTAKYRIFGTIFCKWKASPWKLNIVKCSISHGPIVLLVAKSSISLWFEEQVRFEPVKYLCLQVEMFLAASQKTPLVAPISTHIIICQTHKHESIYISLMPHSLRKLPTRDGHGRITSIFSYPTTPFLLIQALSLY